METFQRAHRARRFFGSRLVLGALLMILLLVLFRALSIMLPLREEREALRKANAEIITLEGRSSALEEKAALLESQGVIDAELRERFTIKREGEQTIVIVGDKESAPQSTSLSWWAWLRSLWYVYSK